MALTAAYEIASGRARLAGTSLGASPVTFQRSTDGGVTWTGVRGAIGVTPTSGNYTAYDYEFPPGVLISYRNVLTSNGSLIGGVVNAVMPEQAVWLKLPLAPGSNRRVTLVGWSEQKRSTRSSVYQVAGRRDPVVVLEPHASREVSIRLRAADGAETAALDAALGAGLPLYLSVPPDCALGSWHAVVKDYTWVRVGDSYSHANIFDVDLVEIAPPAPEVAATASTTVEDW